MANFAICTILADSNADIIDFQLISDVVGLDDLFIAIGPWLVISSSCLIFGLLSRMWCMFQSLTTMRSCPRGRPMCIDFMSLLNHSPSCRFSPHSYYNKSHCSLTSLVSLLHSYNKSQCSLTCVVSLLHSRGLPFLLFRHVCTCKFLYVLVWFIVLMWWRVCLSISPAG